MYIHIYIYTQYVYIRYRERESEREAEMYVEFNICISVCACVCICIHIYICIYKYVYIYLCVCVCLCIIIYTHQYIYIYIMYIYIYTGLGQKYYRRYYDIELSKILPVVAPTFVLHPSSHSAPAESSGRPTAHPRHGASCSHQGWRAWLWHSSPSSTARIRCKCTSDAATAPGARMRLTGLKRLHH